VPTGIRRRCRLVTGETDTGRTGAFNRPISVGVPSDCAFASESCRCMGESRAQPYLGGFRFRWRKVMRFCGRGKGRESAGGCREGERGACGIRDAGLEGATRGGYCGGRLGRTRPSSRSATPILRAISVSASRYRAGADRVRAATARRCLCGRECGGREDCKLGVHRAECTRL
jgi:hypothetical protein